MDGQIKLIIAWCLHSILTRFSWSTSGVRTARLIVLAFLSFLKLFHCRLLKLRLHKLVPILSPQNPLPTLPTPLFLTGTGCTLPFTFAQQESIAVPAQNLKPQIIHQRFFLGKKNLQCNSTEIWNLSESPT